MLKCILVIIIYYSSIRFLRDLWEIYSYRCYFFFFFFFVRFFFQISSKVIIVEDKKNYSREICCFTFVSIYSIRKIKRKKKFWNTISITSVYIVNDIKNNLMMTLTNYMRGFENGWMDKYKTNFLIYIYIVGTVVSFVLISPGTYKGTCGRTNKER